MADVIAEILIDRAIPSVSVDALSAAVRGIIGNKTSGVAKRKDKTVVLLVEQVTPEEDNAIRQLVLNHDTSTRTPEQQIQAAADISRNQIITYIRQQLTNSSPNTAAIKAQVENYVSQHPKLQTAVANVAALYGYDTATNVGYLRAALIVMSFLS